MDKSFRSMFTEAFQNLKRDFGIELEINCCIEILEERYGDMDSLPSSLEEVEEFRTTTEDLISEQWWCLNRDQPGHEAWLKTGKLLRRFRTAPSAEFCDRKGKDKASNTSNKQNARVAQEGGGYAKQDAIGPALFGHTARGQIDHHADTVNTNPTSFNFSPTSAQQDGLGDEQGVPATGSNLGAPNHPSPGQLFASQNIAPRQLPHLHPHIRQSLMQDQHQGGSLPLGGLGGNLAVPSLSTGEHPTTVASTGPRGPGGASLGQSGLDASGRRRNCPQVSQELIEAVAAAVEAHSGQPAQMTRQHKNEDLALRMWIYKKYSEPLPADPKTKKWPCPLCRQKMRRTSLVNHMLSRHLGEIGGDMPEGIRPRLYECGYQGCTAMRGNYRSDALVDHEGRVHGMDVPKRRYSTDEKYLRRKYPSTLRGHNLVDGRDLNAMKERVRRVEQQLAERMPGYQSRHGLDVETTYPSEVAALSGKPRATLVKDLIRLRTDGSMKGRLLCRPDGEGTWKEVVEDLETALMRILDGKGGMEAEDEDEDEGGGDDKDKNRHKDNKALRIKIKIE